MVEGQIADLAVHNGYAYLNSWDEESCTRGGTYVADITNPAEPQEIGFIPATPGYYHGEGAHVVSLNTPQFTGDLLAVNDEACSNDATRPPTWTRARGGFDLYDVTDPAQPEGASCSNAGDTSATTAHSSPTRPRAANSSYHSVFVWQDGPRAFLVGVDNIELARRRHLRHHRSGEPRVHHRLRPGRRWPPTRASEIIGLGANGQNIFNHDMVVKRSSATRCACSSPTGTRATCRST